MISTNTFFSNAKYLILSAFFVLFSSNIYSQEFYHGVGGQIDVGYFTLEYSTPGEDYSETVSPYVPGLFYKATLAFNDKFAISAYPFLGFSGSFNSRSGSSGSVGIQLPVVAEMYFGEMDDACFFAGAGFAYASLGSTDDGGGSAVGPQISIGGQFAFKDRLVGLRAAYTHGLNSTDEISGVEYTKDTQAVISLGAYYVLGGN